MGPPSSAPRVSVIDDEQVVASTLTAILRMHGFAATFFTCPLAAMTAARLKAREAGHLRD
jgi:FixJ family two-component response regulator